MTKLRYVIEFSDEKQKWYVRDDVTGFAVRDWYGTMDGAIHVCYDMNAALHFGEKRKP